MELDKRSRTWVTTVSWTDADPPTEACIPSIGYKSAHLKYSASNQSVSVWFTFDNAVRASSITNGMYGDVVIKRVTPAKHLDEFLALQCSYEVVKSKTNTQVNNGRDTLGVTDDTYLDTNPRVIDMSNDDPAEFKRESSESTAGEESLEQLLAQRLACKKRAADSMIMLGSVNKRIRTLLDNDLT